MVSVRSTPGTRGWPGKCPSKTGLSIGTRASASMRPAARSRCRMESIISKYSRRMTEPIGLRASDLGGFLGHEAVDARAQILEHEVRLGRDLALVDLLGPTLERQLDPEGLVDREGDVEEGEAVDAEIVDGVTLGGDLIPRDVGGLGDDVGHAFEGGGAVGGLVGHVFS